MASVPFNYVDNIFIHDSPVTYRREVARYLDLIRTTDVGRSEASDVALWTIRASRCLN